MTTQNIIMIGKMCESAYSELVEAEVLANEYFGGRAVFTYDTDECQVVVNGWAIPDSAKAFDCQIFVRVVHGDVVDSVDVRELHLATDLRYVPYLSAESYAFGKTERDSVDLGSAIFTTQAEAEALIESKKSGVSLEQGQSWVSGINEMPESLIPDPLSEF